MIGIDATSLKRIKMAYERFGEKFLHRFLLPSEITLCRNSSQSLNIERIAGFWAAKEAISKAIGTGISEQLSFLDIILSKDARGKPLATLRNNKLREFHISSISLSITHDQGLAIAVAFVLLQNQNLLSQFPSS